jgi:3-oxoacyl-[acyl-carrier-protein] synthase II
VIRACVTGLGAVSGYGRTVERFWTGLITGQRAMRAHPLSTAPIAFVAEAPFDAPERASLLARWAAEEALADAGHPPSGPRLGVTVGTTLGGIGGWLRAVRGESDAGPRWSYAGPAQAVAILAGAEGPVETASVACASGNVAIGAALDLVRSGRCDVVLAGGADALHDFVIAGFGALKAVDPEPCRPFDRGRRGLNLGEGAAFLVVEAEPHARARGARVRAFLDGYGLGADAVHMTGPDREGRGAARAMQAALAEARVDAGAVSFVSAHGTATVFNDLMEAKALALVGTRAPVSSIKSAIGHTLGAAGALEAVLCVRTLETGLVPPTIGLVVKDPEIALDVVHGRAREIDARVALSTSSGFGGTNAAIVLGK